ncbi:probable terpene synthase 2 [Medicago truncatula]|uniref:probable terpene synthase 2 n=1 Tax=Medicago truncatula TaxID=3880 RepID=UPI0019685327|nr:probable terpene synthase 2 [Medicago truncatula]
MEYSQTKSLAACAQVDSTQHAVSDFKRPIANFRPCIWGHLFLKYDSESMEIDDNMMQQVQMQKEEVKKLLLSSRNDMAQILNLIDSLQRLGISYQFEHEIDEALEQIHNNFSDNKEMTSEEGDLHFLALVFRLLRQKGHHMSSDIFEKFKNPKGNFNEKISKDIQGMWRLYEAAHLMIHGEDILDEALDFTYSKLNTLETNQVSPFLATQVRHCLKTPLYKRVPRVEIRWWKKSDFVTKVPYARDRVVEAYFWPLAMSYVPKDSIARKIVAKLISVISLVDDTYDAYGTVEELELFTQAIQRWDISLIQSLPECMQVVFNTIVEFYDEMERTIVEIGKSSLVLPYIKQDFYKVARAYLVEAKWCKAGYIPTYDEYKVNGLASTSIPNLILTFLVFGELSNEELVNWILNYPTIIDAVSIFGRLTDDISTNKFEHERVHVASAVDCCMKQYDISQEEAYKLILKEIEDLWRVMNEECLKLHHIPRPVLECILNFARGTHFIYEDFEDKYTNPDLLKDYIAALLVDPISIEQCE